MWDIKILKENLQPNDDQIKILLGENPKKGRYQQTLDKNGNTLWFYWMKNSSPVKLWKRWEKKLTSVDYNKTNYKKEHVIYKLILENKPEAWKWFIEKFNSINIVEENIFGENEIHAAVWSNNIEMLEYYINKKIDIDQKNAEGLTPIMIATNKGIELARMLLLAGADPNIMDSKNKNALHYAAETLDIDMYSLIEDCGGDYKQKDFLQRTPELLMEKSQEKTNKEINANKNYWLKQYEKRKEL